jgi:LysM repeat protein
LRIAARVRLPDAHARLCRTPRLVTKPSLAADLHTWVDPNPNSEATHRMAQNDQRFEQLKQKYQSVQNAITQNQVRLQNLNMQGDKLFIRAEAPSQQAKNRVWDQIKLVDPSYSDLIADISVVETAAPRTQTAGAGIGGGQQSRTYTVQAGDSLSKISRQFYGNANEYMKIFEANRDRLDDPNRIQPGQQLVIPE